MSRPNHGPRLRPNKGGIYFIHWSEDGRSKRRTTGTGNLPEAQKVLAGFLLESERQKTEGSRPTIGWVIEYYDTNHIEPQVTDKARQRKGLSHILAILGEDTFVDELASDDFVRYASKRRKMQSRRGQRGTETNPATIRRELNSFVAACNFAVRNRKMENRQVPVIDLPEHNASKDRHLDREEAQQLFKAAQRGEATRLTRTHRFTAIALGCGRRKQAIETLRWFKVDLKNRMIDFRRPGEPETKKRRGIAAIPDWLIPILERAYREKVSEYVLDTPHSITREFNAARAAAKMPDVTPHTLRHTAGTWLAQSGASIWEIAGAIGCTAATAERNYLHHCPAHLRKVANRIVVDLDMADDEMQEDRA